MVEIGSGGRNEHFLGWGVLDYLLGFVFLFRIIVVLVKHSSI
jgi:hypothetical protein